MPSALTYPGVYVEEIPSGVRTITAVPTSVTAFIGRARKGPVDEAVEITSFTDFERIFGGLWTESKVGYAVRDFYRNGGSLAVVVRLFAQAVADKDRNAVNAAIDEFIKEVEKEDKGSQAKSKLDEAKKTVIDKVEDDQKQLVREKVGLVYKDLKLTLADDDDKVKIVSKADKAAAKGKIPYDFRAISVGTLRFAAKHPGKWASNLRITVERPVDKDGNALPSAKEPAANLGRSPEELFTLTVIDESPGGRSETFINLTVKPSIRRVDNVLNDESELIRWAGGDLATDEPSLSGFSPSQGDDVIEKRKLLKDARDAHNISPISDPDENKDTGKRLEKAKDALFEAERKALQSVTDGPNIDANSFLGSGRDGKKGLYALEQLFTRGGIFNLLCIPPYKDSKINKVDVDPGVLAEAVAYAELRRAMVIVDPPVEWSDVAKSRDRFGKDDDNLPRSKNAAVFFPRIKQPNPLQNGRIEDFAPCGVVAGIFARTDAQRGVWKAPAGLDASLVGVSSLSVPMTDEDNGLLNPLGINCLRSFPVFGKVIWGARTLRGADDYADEYKYIPVRRTALFIEESLYRGLKWVVFEPNDEPLWAQIRLNVGAFMHNLFRQGAFQGASKREAYFVKCDAETTTQNDINLGIVNIHVGFAPLKPAEFVVIKLQQMIGQIET
ncbi:phage tail sheath family protein [Azotobacter chroococcum]|uniref:phage tail sheath family protein n=1 Tax=Azotobacter chroococcum TaxID=353 RepID=UPI0010AE96CD|nr:phage tail sheath C-terminal domain-containing protein [Azotobacter chroococcum]TKD31589.1 phage tail sheath family protein [Azotobacter chroococcum]